MEVDVLEIKSKLRKLINEGKKSVIPVRDRIYDKLVCSNGREIIVYHRYRGHKVLTITSFDVLNESGRINVGKLDKCTEYLKRCIEEEIECAPRVS